MLYFLQIKKCVLFILVLVSTQFATIAMAQLLPEAPGSVTFYYSKSLSGAVTLRKTSTYSWGIQTEPNTGSAIISDNSEGNFSSIVNRTEKRANETLQDLSFTFRSNGFFRTGGHLAVFTNYANGSFFNRGRGIIIGRNKSSSAPIGCNSPLGYGWVQPETWWTYYLGGTSYIDQGQTKMVGTSQVGDAYVAEPFSCAVVLQDYVDYFVRVTSSGGVMNFLIAVPGTKNIILSGSFSDAGINKERTLINGLTGYAFNSVFGNSAPGTSWSIDLKGINNSWY
jgi:hypothetical protein